MGSRDGDGDHDDDDTPPARRRAANARKSETIRVNLVFMFEVAIKVCFPFLVGIAGWTGTSLLDLNNRVQRLENTRYTRENAEAEFLRIREELRAIQKQAAEAAAEDRATSAILLRLEVNVRDIINRLPERK